MTLTKLTKEQEAKLADYRDEGFQYGLATETFEFDENQDELKALVDAAYAAGGLPPPDTIEITAGPVALQERVNELMGTKGEWYSACYGQHDASFLQYYAFFNNETEVDCSPIMPLRELSKRVGWFIPLSDVCVISYRPTVLRMRQGKLHCVDGPAIEYMDGLKVFALYGVVFSEEDANKFYLKGPGSASVEDILSVKNVEQRAALIQLNGIKEFIASLNPKVLDKEADDELLEVMVGQQRRVYYHMQNPSVDERHLEPVPPEIKTIKEAIMWRNYGDHTLPFKRPDALT